MGNKKNSIALNKEEILTSLEVETASKIGNDIEILESIDSTNEYLLRKYGNKPEKFKFVLAETQTAGKGTYGKSWDSPTNLGIWLSFTWEVKDKSMMSSLSIVIGIFIYQALNKYTNTKELKLKWPNDIYYSNQKLGGILIEQFSMLKENPNVVVGIGLNIYKNSCQTNYKKTSLSEISEVKINRNLLAADIITKVITELNNLNINSVNNLMLVWPKFDKYYKKSISVKIGNKTISGQNIGINFDGSLKLLTTTGVVNVYQGKILETTQKT
ncbi:MAG: biotin--[acetyl-CoA-carboxylase] ligase [Pseudomonadota bacterium]|nr:biotin--[acetyl-CoA-carboxylase] ligase [Pseudomonadota bacterium]